MLASSAMSCGVGEQPARPPAQMRYRNRFQAVVWPLGDHRLAPLQARSGGIIGETRAEICSPIFILRSASHRSQAK